MWYSKVFLKIREFAGKYWIIICITVATDRFVGNLYVNLQWVDYIRGLPNGLQMVMKVLIKVVIVLVYRRI